MVSSRGGAPFDVSFARHICADPNPEGPGYREDAVLASVDTRQPGLFQPAFLGSYGVAAAAIGIGAGFAASATLWPTAPGRGMQGAVSLAGCGWSFMLGIAPGGGAMVRLQTPSGIIQAEIGAVMLARRWYDIACAVDDAGTLHLGQRPHRRTGHVCDWGSATAVGAVTPGVADQVLLAATPSSSAPASCHLNGKLQRPTLWHRATLEQALEAQHAGPHAEMELAACWDFSIGIDGFTAHDIGPLGAHAELKNLPTRAMTGSNWNGQAHSWSAIPDQYGAIHFHDDDRGDVAWRESFRLVVPDDWPSGIYSAHIRNPNGEDRIPFIVRPTAPRAEIAVLVPTYTYQIYACYAVEGKGRQISERAAAWGALPETPDMNPEFGLSCYNLHSDGSGVALCSMLRPMLNIRPRQINLIDPAPGGSGCARLCADTYVIDWLTHIDVAHDVITDHDLHAEGTGLLAPYRTVIALQHPEYVSANMMDGFEAYLGGGGRLMYLGGNGFYWRAEPCAAAPHALEVRRAEGGVRVAATAPGESYHAFGGGYGGLWRRIGRPAHALVGNGFSAQGRHLGFPYHFTDGIADPRVAFMRKNLDVKAGQTFGESGFMGGGAAGFELDSVNPEFGSPPNTLVVAKGIVIHPDFGPANEDRLVQQHPRRQQDWSCADMLFFETAAGGAVFSVGSMTYVGSLAVNGYDNVLARLTTNVLRRFTNPAPFA